MPLQCLYMLCNCNITINCPYLPCLAITGLPQLPCHNYLATIAMLERSCYCHHGTAAVSQLHFHSCTHYHNCLSKVAMHARTVMPLSLYDTAVVSQLHFHSYIATATLPLLPCLSYPALHHHHARPYVLTPPLPFGTIAR